MAVEDPASFKTYLSKLGAAAGIEIHSYQSLLDALKSRHDYFHAAGGRLSDHGLNYFVYNDFTEAALEQAFQQLFAGRQLDAAAAAMFKSATLHFICQWNHAKGWVQQFHVGPSATTTAAS